MLLAILVALSAALPTDTVVRLGSLRRDLTGDGTPEILRLVGKGRTLDSLAVTFTIESSGTVVFEMALSPLTRTAGSDGNRRLLTRPEHRTRLSEFPEWFFAESKFMRPRAFVDQLHGQAPRHVALIPEVVARDRRRQLILESYLAVGLSRDDAVRKAGSIQRSLIAQDTSHARSIWEEIQRAGVTVFQFSPGGDTIVAIAWSARDRRFYRLWECC